MEREQPDDGNIRKADSRSFREFQGHRSGERIEMRAAIYDRAGRAHDVLGIVELPTPAPSPGEVRVQVTWSGINPFLSTVSSPDKAALAKSAGADIVLNYKTEDIDMRVKEATSGCGIDRIVDVDVAANIEIDLRFLKTGGEIIVYGSNAEGIGVPFFPMILKHARLRFFLVYNLSSDLRERAIGHVTDMLEESCLTHNIAARLPLERIADAHELVEQGRVPGKVILAIN